MSMEDPLAALLFLAEQIRQSQEAVEEDPCEPPPRPKAVRKPTPSKKPVAKKKAAPVRTVRSPPPKPAPKPPPSPTVAQNGGRQRLQAPRDAPRVTIGEQVAELPPSTALMARNSRSNGGTLPPPTRVSATRVPPPPPPPRSNGGAQRGSDSAPDRALIGPERAPALEPQELFEEGGVLLRPGRLRIEPTFSYSRSDRSRILFDGIDLIDVVFIGQIYSDQIRNETFSSSVTFRYGASDRLNLRATIPWEYRKTELFPIERDQAPISALQTRENSSVGDISLGLSYQLYRSDTRLPSVVANLTYSPDTGDPPYTGRGYKRLTGGFTFLMQSDPAVLFGSLSYLHNEGEYKSFERGDFVGGSFGYSYALNYDLSISTTLSYLRQIEDSTLRRPQGGRLTLGRRETDATLSLGLTYALTRRTALALSVGIGLTDESPELTLSMSLPMAFNTSGWW
jgi:hypothetical protein